MPTDFEPDLADLSDSRGSASDPLADHKRRARWRFVGAFIFCAASAGLALTILESEPRPLAQDFILRWPSAPEAGRPGDEPAVLAGEPSKAETPKAPAVATESAPPKSAKPDSKSDTKPEAKPEAKRDPPKSDSPKSDSPKSDSPKSDSPKADSPKADSPKADSPKAAPNHYVQVGAYNTRSSAEATRRKLEASGHKVSVSTVSTADGVRYRVRVGPFNAAEADSVRARAKLQGYDAILIRPESRGAR